MSESFVATVIADGRITIPDDIRELLEIKEGDKIRAIIEKIPNKKKGA